MSDLRRPFRLSLMTVAGCSLWLAADETASAQALLAQSGTAKTMIGWLLVLLAIGLGLLVACRPSGRKASEGDKKW